MLSTREIELLPKINVAFAEQNWDELSKLLSPRLFATIQPGDLIAPQVLAKVAQILTKGDSVPDKIKISCLKCLGNSCFNGYKYKEYSIEKSNRDNCCRALYSVLAEIDENSGPNDSYPYDSHFPYEGIARWTSNYLIANSRSDELLDDQLEILRLSVQFLCNLFTFACKDENLPDKRDIPECLKDSELKNAVINYIHSGHAPIVKASSIFVHNALRELENEYFSDTEKASLCSKLIKPIKDGFASARESLLLLQSRENILRNAYDDMSMEDKLYLLELIYNEASETAYQSEAKNDEVFAEDTIAFLAERFRRRSDLILKTVDTYLDGMEPTEIMILLDILGALTTADAKAYAFLKNDKNLLINCTYLLKSVQMIGKESSNCFTPMQKLSDIAPAGENLNGEQQSEAVGPGGGKKDFHGHPAFGFKAGLIRVIGNMSYRNRMCQDLLREMDAIPLLLDCCNIDARNPLIMQWTILALRNLCEGNHENQRIIRDCTKVGLVENAVLTEMGVTLHEEQDGRKIGVVPLVRDRKG